jgi:hypothetical protein
MLHTEVVCVGVQEIAIPAAITTEKKRIRGA